MSHEGDFVRNRAREEANPAAKRLRSTALRTAVIGLIAALCVGMALRFEVHRLLSPRAAPVVGAGR